MRTQDFSTRGNLVVSCGGNQRALVIEHFPTARGESPERRSPAETPAILLELIGGEEQVLRQWATSKTTDHPVLLDPGPMAIRERVQHVLARIDPSRRADFPEALVGHPLEVRAGRAELRVMKDGLARGELLRGLLQ